MALGIFIGLPESDLLAIRAQAVADITSGRVITSYSTGDGSSVSKSFAMPPKEVLAEVRMALQTLNPDEYGKRTVVVRTNWAGFNGW